ncbi:MAG: hypothetical protein V1837_06020 [Candidatus Woesearchaeota archaeon]
MTQTIGGWAFIIGVIIAVISGFFMLSATLVSVLVLLGLIVGFLNITGKETMGFLMATVSLVIVSYFGGQALSEIAFVGTVLAGIMNAIMIFVVPATIVVALKSIFAMAHD